ncbi:hypothetical protein [Thermoactinospora rubra]|uniref:hypothetical protein n=1 Tax=Thermoactinospora rubra TaxID=1088767 RepID=UPI000A0FE98D|nr:hypothetical protein [Thermoactinospora rubra]
MTEVDRRAAAHTLRSLRERRGWSWSDQARALKATARTLSITPVAHLSVASLIRTIARWEREDRPTAPGERYQLLLAYVFARKGDEVMVGRGSDLDRLMALFPVWGTSAERAAEIRGQVTQAVTSGHALLAFLSPGLAHSLARALTDPDTLTPDVVRQLGDLVSDVNAQIGAVPFARLQLALAPAVEACRVLLAAGPPEPVRRTLAQTAANAFMIAARVAFETREDNTSTGLYKHAVQAAVELPAWERVAIRTSQALVTLYATRDVTAARAVADTAVREARRGDSRIVRARAHALQAEMAARAGQEHHAFAALHLAWRDIDSDITGDPAPGRFGAGYLDGFEGVCNLHLGRGSEAEPQLAHSLSTLTHPRQAVQRAVVAADLALARLQCGSPEAAAALLHDCIDLAATTRARVPALRIAQVRRNLRPWRAEPFVADLDEHLHESLLAP